MEEKFKERKKYYLINVFTGFLITLIFISAIFGFPFIIELLNFPRKGTMLPYGYLAYLVTIPFIAILIYSVLIKNKLSRNKVYNGMSVFLNVMLFYTGIGCLLASIGLIIRENLSSNYGQDILSIVKITLPIGISCLILFIAKVVIHKLAKPYRKFNNLTNKTYKLAKNKNLSNNQSNQYIEQINAAYNNYNFNEINRVYIEIDKAIDNSEKTSKEELQSKSYYDDHAIPAFFAKIGRGLLLLITLGIAYPFVLCMKIAREVKHTKYDGYEMYFNGNGGQLIGKWIIWILLCIPTFGIYAFFIPNRIKKWVAKHTHFKGVQSDESGNYTGIFIVELLLKIGCLSLTLITLFIMVPFVSCWKYAYKINHTIYDGKKLKFKGNGAQLIGKWILWLLLCIPTFGIFIFFLPGRIKRWKISKTHYSETLESIKEEKVKTKIKENALIKPIFYQKPLLYGLSFISIGIPIIVFLIAFNINNSYWKDLKSLNKFAKIVSSNAAYELRENFPDYIDEEDKYYYDYDDVKVIIYKKISRYEYVVGDTPIEDKEIKKVELLKKYNAFNNNIPIKVLYEDGSAMYDYNCDIVSSTNFNVNEQTELKLIDSFNYVYEISTIVEESHYSNLENIDNIEYNIIKENNDYYTILIEGSGTCDLSNISQIPIYQNELKYEDDIYYKLKISEGITNIENSSNFSIDYYAIELPSTLKAIGNYAFDDSKILNDIILPEGLESIGNYAFSNCNLSSLILPETLINLGDYCFSYNNLTNLIIPDSVNSIGEYILRDNLNLKELALPYLGSNKNNPKTLKYLTYSPIALEKLTINSGTIINSAIYNYSDLYYIELGEDVDIIEDYGLCNAENLKIVRVNGDIKELGSHIIDNTQVEELVFNNIGSIDDSAFVNSNLKSLIINGNVDSIGKYILEGVELDTLKIPYFGSNIDDSENAYLRYFYNGNNELTLYLKEIKIKNIYLTKAKYLADRAILETEGLENVYLPSTLEKLNGSITANPSNKHNVYYAGTLDNYLNLELKDSIFSNNYKFYILEDNEYQELTGEVTIPEGYEELPKHSFADSSITKINLPSTLKVIGMYALSNTDLTSITLPEGLEVIENNAFSNNKKLKTISLSSTITTINYGAFRSCSFETFYLPYIENVNEQLFDSANIGILTISGAYKTLPNILSYIDNVQKLVLETGIEIIDEKALEYSQIEEIVLPDTLTTIKANAFYNSNISRIELPNTLKEIGKSAFESFETDNLTIPNQVKIIKERTFDNANINNIILEGVEEIGDFAFYNSNITSISLPNTLKIIGSYVFEGTNLSSLIIPNSVERIDGNLIDSNDEINDLTLPFIGYDKDNKTTLKTLLFGDAYVYNYRLNSLTLTEETILKADAVRDFKIKYLVLPETLIEIDEDAFYDSKVEYILYSGIEDQNNLFIDYDNVYYYSDTYQEGNYWHYVDDEIVIWTKEAL